MTSYRKQIIFIVFCVLVCVFLVASIFVQVRQSAVREMNERQSVYARLAAKGIESILTHYMATLRALAQNPHVIAMDNEGRQLLRAGDKASNSYLSGITRMDARGVITYTFPSVAGSIGTDLSGQAHVQKVLRDRKLVVSDVFEAVQGFPGVAMHMPVFRGKSFDGTIAFLIDFSGLADNYLDNLYIENKRYALLLNSEGKIIHCINPEHTGRLFTEFYPDNAGIAAVLDEIRKGEEVETSFLDRHLPGKTNRPQKGHAVFAPIRAGEDFWSIAVISSETLMLPAAQKTQYQIILLAMVLVCFFAMLVYTAARIRGASVEAQKRQKIEDDLVKSAKEISDLYHNAPCGYHSLDAEGRIVRINDMELSWLGYAREELIGKAYAEILSPVGRKHFAEAFGRLQQEGLVRDVEYEMVRKDGTTFPVLVTASAITDERGKFVMSRSMVMDMTQRRAQEERLRESEALYRTALETTSDGITITDIQKGTYLYVNQKMMETLGRPPDNIIGSPVDLYVHPDDMGLGRTYYRKRKKEGKAASYFESRVIKADGSLAIVSVTATDIIFQGHPAVISFVQDITEKKRQEDTLRESEILYRTALESTSDGVTILQNGVYVYVNQQFLDTMGIALDAIINRPLGALAGPEPQQGFRKFLEKHPQDDSLPEMHVTRVAKSDGSLIYLQSSSVDIVYHGKPAILTFIKDITEQKKAEQALRESEELYRTAFEKTHDGISILQDEKHVFVNQRLLHTLGRREDELIGQPLGAYIHPDDLAKLEQYFTARIQGKPAPSNYDIRVMKPDGDMAMLNINAIRINYKGKPSTLSFVTDITERKRAEDVLRESEELYRTALENTSDGISIVQENRYVYVNQKFLYTIGRDESEVVNMPLGVFIHPEDAEMVRKNFAARIQGDQAPPSYDIRVMKPDGTYVTLNIRAIRISYQGKPATLSFILDFTERKKAEEALRESEERYRTIIESIDDDYFETDLGGVITFFNRSVACSGISREELIGTNHREFVTPETGKKITRFFQQVYESGKPQRMLDYEVLHKDGSVIHQEISLSLMRNAQGKPVGFRGISRDVSERFRMDEERRKLTEQLHQAQKMEAIGTLAGGIAHDFNNLLMGIQGYTSLMLLDTEAPHPCAEQLRAVQTLVQSGANLTRQLLGFARAGRYEVVPTHLNDLISKSVSLFARTKKEIRIFEKYAENIQTVDVDRGQIEQVLLNMFVNAWQAMPAGGSLYVDTQNATMDASLAAIHDLKPGRYVKISITDTGVGMDERTRQRIFDPFFTTKEMGRGTGLGLASAYGIIKGHSGMISVYSEKGQGTTFNIYLPASLKDVPDEEAADTELQGGGETILLVDDEEVITEVTGKLLAELGYTIITAQSGTEALDLYAARHAEIDLVIIDMIMPGLSGSDTFDQLKAINPAVRTILSSGYSVNGKAKAIMDRGVRVFLQKPYRLHDLARKIREALAD